MNDLWIDVVMTVVVAFLTITADALAGRLVALSAFRAGVEHIASKTDVDAQKKLGDIVAKLGESKSESIFWGTEFAAISFAIFIAILGVYIDKPSYFPFFNQWNTDEVPRDLPVWIIILFVAFLLLAVSIGFKHLHRQKIAYLEENQIEKSFSGKWVWQNNYWILGNLIGVVALFLSFWVITYAN